MAKLVKKDDREITFSKWVPWSERRSLIQNDGPWLGVYLWARFRRPPPPSVKAYPKLSWQVIYVGETKHIDKRPLTGEHHRLVHYREKFPEDPNLKMLYVAVGRVQSFPRGYVSKKDRGLYTRLRVYTQYVESKIYWEYTKKCRRPPALHYKKKANARD